ncbi:hypothetical protein JXA63_05305 [Candidatus Woesebacteria bacterium]|nr:hypothetical protein [Candidatus Woesebacteria bacterium]
MRIIKYNEFEKDFADQWRELWIASKEANFFNSPEWFRVNLETYGYKNYCIFAAYNNDELVGIIPLVEKKVFGVKFLTDANNFFSEKSSLLFKNNSDILSLRKAISEAAKCGNLLLRELPDGVARDISIKKYMSFAYLISVNPYIDIRSDVFSDLSRKQKSKIASKIKKANKLNHEAINNVGLKDLKSIKEIEKNSFKNKKGRSVLNDDVNFRLF